MRGANFNLNELTSDIQARDMNKVVRRLVEKWSVTGLLEGLNGKHADNMAVLLENQAAELLNETSQVADIIGFQNVAFPIVRRVFGGLIANELVSVQPMSLPSGLLFYLDYRFDTVKAGNKNNDFTVGGSLFGDQTAPGTENLATNGLYNLGTSYSQRERVGTAKFAYTSATASLSDINWDPDLSASIATDDTKHLKKLTLTSGYSEHANSGSDRSINGLKHWMPVSGTSTVKTTTTDGTPIRLGTDAAADVIVYRRFTVSSGDDLVFIVSGTLPGEGGVGTLVDSTNNWVYVSYLVDPSLTGGTSGTLVVPAFESDFASSPTPVIPEIDLRIQSVSVTAETRKLKAKWTPELAQDLAAYQNLDAEVELTQILSEQIALEIDREILADLLYGATGETMYWSRKPGNFLDKLTGNTATGASFTGTVREWYETLIETIIDVANEIHRKTLRGSANFIVTSPDVCTILEASVLYKPAYTLDSMGQVGTPFSVGAEAVGTLSYRFTVYKDPYFPRNKILVGYKGGSYLETGYVYAPYVPLIVTPTIFAPEDFTPRKGVMTRYGKKMVRSDFYGTVTIIDLNVI